MRRRISCTFAVVFGALALAIFPAASLAGGAFPLCGGAPCPTKLQAEVEVILLPPNSVSPRNEAGRMRAPGLPARAPTKLLRLENHYFQQLIHIETDICKSVQTAHEEGEGEEVAIGFSSQLGKFEGIRTQLSALLNRFRRGWAPTLAEFSGLEYFEITIDNNSTRTKHGYRQGPELIEEIDIRPACTYRII